MIYISTNLSIEYVGIKQRFDCLYGNTVPSRVPYNFYSTRCWYSAAGVFSATWVDVRSEFTVTIREFILWSWCSGHFILIMHQRHLPASPNWYCSRCSDINGKGALGFGAKNTIYLLNVTAASPAVTGMSSGCFNIMLLANSHWSDQTFFLQVNSLGTLKEFLVLHFAPMMDKNTFVLVLQMTRQSKSGIPSRKFCWKSTMSTKWVNILPVILKVLWLACSLFP